VVSSRETQCNVEQQECLVNSDGDNCVSRARTRLNPVGIHRKKGIGKKIIKGIKLQQICYTHDTDNVTEGE